MSEEHQATLCSLPTERLEALAEALLDFHSGADLEAWLTNHQPG